MEHINMKAENGRMKGDLRVRTKQFALAIISFYSTLPRRKEAQVIGDQLLRSGTSVGAHFREAQRAKSVADFISKMEGGLQELDETAYWLELLKESGLNISKQLDILQSEANQLIAIFVTIVKKTKASSKRTA
jgi:four helix bundle protein